MSYVACGTLLAAHLCAEIASFAQDKPDRPPWARKSKTASAEKSPPATEPAEPDDSQEAGQRGRIRVSVNLVNVLVSVLDEHNRPAPDLPRESFQLFEEGVEQKIEVFESETQLPLDLALMIDSSLSAHKEIAFEQDAAVYDQRHAEMLRQTQRAPQLPPGPPPIPSPAGGGGLEWGFGLVSALGVVVRASRS